jgi:hypothetical protein
LNGAHKWNFSVGPIKKETMTSICVNPDPNIGNLPPAYCNSSYIQSSVYNGLCQPYKDAINALHAKMGSSGTTSSAITFKMPVATCKVVPANMITEASNNGLDIIRLQDNWAAQSTGVATDSQCTGSGYGIFDASGNKVMTTNAAGAAIPTTVDILYEDHFSDCTHESDETVAPYFLKSTTGTCPTASFVSQCQDPMTTVYAPCRNPGWDYMDTSGTWTFDMNSCTNGSFTGNQYVNQTDNAEGVDCTKQCCIYASLVSTDVESINCGSCTQTSDTSSPYYQNWANGPEITLSNKDGASISVPYCNQMNSTFGKNSQGFALSLTDAETNPNVAKFGDPAECRSGGDFASSCAGITGCDGLPNHLKTDGAKFKPCRLGFSSGTTSTFEPASNCPNIYTLVDSSQDCRFSTTGSGSSLTYCKPGETLINPGTCEDFDTGDFAARPILTDIGYPRVKQLTLPEGAWVTAYNNSAPGRAASEAPDFVNAQLCNPNEFPSDGQDAWTFGCGRDQVGNLVGKSESLKVMPSGKWEEGTMFKENAGYCTSSTADCVNTSTDFDTTRESGDVTVNPSSGSCTFTVNETTPLYGWTLGFMPGYYNSTCSTHSTGNECGTLTS